MRPSFFAFLVQIYSNIFGKSLRFNLNDFLDKSSVSTYSSNFLRAKYIFSGSSGRNCSGALLEEAV